MSIIKNIITWTERTEGLNGLSEAFKKFDEAETALDLGAAGSQVISELAVAGVVTGTLRTTMSALRLGLAVSGQIWKWEALTKLSGVASGLTAGQIIDWANEQNIGGTIYDWTHTPIPDPTTNTHFLGAKNWVPPRDPLVLDLDGDGIETVGIDPSNPILFDHNGDGVKTATGWIKADDGILVMDRDGNGLIETGRELFGDATVLEHGARAGQLAANGYEALADLDGNADNVLDSTDAAWGQVRVWRDLNQDGISQAGELESLDALGISSIGVQGTQNRVDLGGGNTQTMSGGFTRSNGSTGASGVAEVSGNLLLAANNFYSEFTDEVALADGVQAMAQVQGSGMVRDLHQAMSLGTAQSVALQSALAGFAAGKHRRAQWPSVSLCGQKFKKKQALALAINGFSAIELKQLMPSRGTEISVRAAGIALDYQLHQERYASI